MVAPRSNSRRRNTSVKSRSDNQSGTYSKKDRTSPRYIENAVIAFEEFGDAPGVLKCYEFKDKVRTSEKLKRNIVIKIEVSEDLLPSL